jgi:enoyl-CoA hydratase/carnithine racemase
VLAMELARGGLAPTELSRATLEARIYNPDEAAGVGYLHDAVPAERLLERALAEAGRLGQLSKTAYAASKKRLRGQTIKYIRDTLQDDVRELMSGAP